MTGPDEHTASGTHEFDPAYLHWSSIDDGTICSGIVEFSAAVGLSPRTVIRRIHGGKIPSIISGGRRLIPKFKAKTAA